MTRESSPPAACLDPETLGALAEGGLAGAERAAAVRHLASCRRCHEVFASTLQILEEEGLLSAVAEEGIASAASATRRPLSIWVSAAAAALVSAALFVPRATVLIPRVADASPSPSVTLAPVPAATSSPASPQTASLPPEAIEALRTLKGFELPYVVQSAVGFAPDPRKAGVRKGIADVDAAAKTLAPRRGLDARTVESQADSRATVDSWRRVGRVLEASRLALSAPPGAAEAFFASPWTRIELAHVSALLREVGVADTAWADDVRRGRFDDVAAEKLRDRLDKLLEELS